MLAHRIFSLEVELNPHTIRWELWGFNLLSRKCLCALCLTNIISFISMLQLECYKESHKNKRILGTCQIWSCRLMVINIDNMAKCWKRETKRERLCHLDVVNHTCERNECSKHTKGQSVMTTCLENKAEGKHADPYTKWEPVGTRSKRKHGLVQNHGNQLLYVLWTLHVEATYK